MPHGLTVAGDRWDFGFRKRIGHGDRRIHLWSDVIEGEIEWLHSSPPRDANALHSVNERRLGSINSWMHNVDKLVRSIAGGAVVTLSSPWGSIDVTARVIDAIRPSAVAHPHGWAHRGGWVVANEKPGNNLNAITPATPRMAEQVNGMSYLEGFDVQVRPR